MLRDSSWLTRGRTLAWSLAGLALILMSLEFGFRIYFRNDYGFPNYRNWYFKRIWYESFVNLNSLGHRDKEFSREKPPDTFRILVLGDAHTYGEGVERVDDLFTEILETRLNKRGPMRFEVLNVSNVVWEIADYLSALREYGLSYEPDIVVVGLYINDIENRDFERPVPTQAFTERFIPARFRGLLKRVSFLYAYTVSRYEKEQHKQFWLDYVASYTDMSSHHWQRFVPIFRELLSDCRNSDIPVLVLVLPYLVVLDDSHPFTSVYEALEEISWEEGAYALNLFPVLREYSAGELRAGVNWWRSGEQTHRIVADTLYEWMTTDGASLLP